MWDMWNYKSSPSTRVGKVQWFKPLLKCFDFILMNWRNDLPWPGSHIQSCSNVQGLPEWPRLPGCLERNFLWTSKSHEIERWIKKLKKQNCRINPMKMPSKPRTVYPLSLWFLSNVLMSRHLRLMIRLAMAVLFKWNALQSILLTFLIIKIKQIRF